MGWNMPDQTRAILSAIRERWPEITEFHCHFHNTRGVTIASYYMSLYSTAAPLSIEPGFPLYLALFLITYIAAERLFVLLQRHESAPSRVEDFVRSVLVGLTVLFGVIGLFEWAPENHFIFYLLGLSVMLISFGALFRESRYRWGALFLFVVLTIRAFLYLRHLSPLYQVFTFGASAVVLLAVSWAYSQIRQRSTPKKEGDSAAAPSDG